MGFPKKTWLNIIGGALGLIGIVFVGLRLNAYADRIDFSRFTITAWLFISFLAVVYGTANIMFARAWWHLLGHLKVRADWVWALKAYGQSQLAKYIPGNIFHLAGRQALGMAAGIPVRPLAKSVMWELGVHVVAGAIFGCLCLPLVWPDFSLMLSLLLFIVVVALLFVALYSFFSSSVAIALLWQLVFLAVSGAVFFSVLSVVVPTSVVLPAVTTICGAYVIAWLAGLVTPGAPAGVGVREMLLLFFLGGQIGQADLLLAVLLGRVVTVFGDLLFFMAAIVFCRGLK